MRQRSFRPWVRASGNRHAAARLVGLLSEREREVMWLVVRGRTSKEIARVLCISPCTVRKHRENLLRKLDLHTTTQLAAHVSRAA